MTHGINILPKEKLTCIWDEKDLGELTDFLRGRYPALPQKTIATIIHGPDNDWLHVRGLPSLEAIYEVIYCEYEDLPLFVNLPKDMNISRTILIWRLDHGI